MSARRIEFGSTGVPISRLGLGTSAFGGPGWRCGWEPQTAADSRMAIRRAIELGMSWIDTAAAYGRGRAERMIRHVLAEVPAVDRPLLFTKGGTLRDRAGRPRIADPGLLRREVEGSLGRLGVDRVDLYQLHAPPEDGTPIEETWGALAELVHEGKIRWLGACDFTAELLDRCERIHPVTAVQGPLSIVDATSSARVIRWCRGHGSAFLAYRPLHSGLLTGFFTARRAASLPATDWRRHDPAFCPPGVVRNLEVVERLSAIAYERGCSVAELAIAWTLVSGATAAIVAARSRAQVDLWAGAADLELEQNFFDRIRHARAHQAGGVRQPREQSG